MTINPDLFAALIAAMFGGGGLFAMMIRWLETRRDRPLSEVTSLAEVQKQIREEVRLENAELRSEISNMRIALLKLTDLLDELLPLIDGLSAHEKAKLHEAHKAAKLAF